MKGPKDPKQIRSPKENIAEDELLIVSDAQIKIKEIIVADIKNMVDKEVTARKIDLVIASAVRKIRDNLKEEVRQSLINSTRLWYYEYSQNMRILTNDMQRVLIVNGFVDLSQRVTSATIVDWNADAYFRNMTTNAEIGIQIISDYQDKVKTQLMALSAQPPISTRVDKDGNPYKISLRNLAEMRVRYEANQADVAKFINDGIDLVWASSHVNASARCAQYQGRLYSISGLTGKTKEGISYTPLKEALDGPLGDGNGIINGYNCRHYLIEYRPNSKAPIDFDEKTIQRERAIDSRQRYYENSIRNLKAQERLFRAEGNTNEANLAKKKWQALTNNYQRYSNKNGRAYYLWRTRIDNSEIFGYNDNQLKGETMTEQEIIDKKVAELEESKYIIKEIQYLKVGEKYVYRKDQYGNYGLMNEIPVGEKKPSPFNLKAVDAIKNKYPNYFIETRQERTLKPYMETSLIDEEIKAVKLGMTVEEYRNYIKEQDKRLEELSKKKFDESVWKRIEIPKTFDERYKDTKQWDNEDKEKYFDRLLRETEKAEEQIIKTLKEVGYDFEQVGSRSSKAGYQPSQYFTVKLPNDEELTIRLSNGHENNTSSGNDLYFTFKQWYEMPKTADEILKELIKRKVEFIKKSL